MTQQPETPEEILQRLEDDVLMDPYHRGRVFRDLAERYKEQGDDARAEEMKSLQFAFHFMPAGHELKQTKGDRARFRPMIEAEGGAYPSFDLFTPERWQRIRNFRDSTRNAAIRARLSDLLWEGQRDHQSAQIAVDSYLECAPLYGASDEAGHGMAMVDALLRAMEVSVQINHRERTGRAVMHVRDTIRTLIKGGRPRWALDLTQGILGCKKVRRLLPLGELHDLIEQALVGFNADPDSSAPSLKNLYSLPRRPRGRALVRPRASGSRPRPCIVKALLGRTTSHFKREWLSALEQVARAKGDSQLSRACKIRVGGSFERGADFWVEHGSHLPAVSLYQDAVAAYKKAGRCPEKVAAVLKKLENATQSGRADLKRIQVPLRISGEEMDAWRAEVLGNYGKFGLAILAYDDYTLPDVKGIRQSVVERQKEFPLQSLFPAVMMQGGRVVSTASTPEEHAALQATHELLPHLEVRTVSTAKWVFQAIRDGGGTVREGVMKEVTESPVIQGWRRPLLDAALERFDAGDYVSGVHILVFQIEGIVRDLAGMAGLPRVIEKDGATPARALNDLLYDPDVVAVLGEGLAAALRALLVDPVGKNIRNLVAHGLADDSAFDESNGTLLVVLLLNLAAFRQQSAQDDQGHSGSAPCEVEGQGHKCSERGESS